MILLSELPQNRKLVAFCLGIALFLMIFCLACGAMGGYAYARFTSARTQKTVAETVAGSFKDLANQLQPAQPTSKPITPAISPESIVHRGEGVESSLIRQLIAHPSIADFSGNRNDPTAVKQWAGREAHLLAIKAGFYEWKFGEEMWVKTPNTVAIVIQKDASGKLSIAEYAVSANNTIAATATATHPVASNITTSHFIGPMDGTSVFQTTYLYMYTG